MSRIDMDLHPYGSEILWELGQEDTGHLLKTGDPPAINLSLPKASVKLPSGQQFLSGLKRKESYIKSDHEHESAVTTD